MPIGLRRPHNFAAGFAIKFLKKNKKMFVFGREEKGVWRETSSQFRVLSVAFLFKKKKQKKRKWTICLRRPHNFAAGFALKFVKKNHKKTDMFFQERAFGLRRPHNFAISLAFCLFKKIEKRTFRLRRPHNFADQHGRWIDRYVSKTDVWLETSSQFRFPICQNMINSLYFLGENGRLAWDVLTISRSLRRFLSTKKTKSKNCRLAWDVLIISLPVSRSNFWKKIKKCLFLGGRKRAFGVRRPHNFVFSPSLFCSRKKNKKNENGRFAWDVLTISRLVSRSNLWKKIIRKRICFFKNGRLGWDVLTISRSRLLFVCLKKLKNGRFAWDVLTILQTNTVVESIVTFQKRTFGLRRPHNFAFQFVKTW